MIYGSDLDPDPKYLLKPSMLCIKKNFQVQQRLLMFVLFFFSIVFVLKLLFCDEDGELAAEKAYGSVTAMKSMGRGSEPVGFCVMNQANFETVLRHILLVRHLRVNIQGETDDGIIVFVWQTRI